MRTPTELPGTLRELLERSRQLGFLGPGPLDRHVDHALGFGRTIRWALAAYRTSMARPSTGATYPIPSPSSAGFASLAEGPRSPQGTGGTEGRPELIGRLVDLGSGGGVPGLVLAWSEPGLRVTLLDANTRRCELLEDGVRQLGISSRVAVVQERAELIGHDPAFRGGFDIATARSFGPPAVTAECAAPLLVVGGFLVTSEPPPVPGHDVPSEEGDGAAAARSGPGREPPVSSRRPSEPSRRGRRRSGRGGDEATGNGGPTRWPAEALGQLGMEPLAPHFEGFAYQVVRQVATCPDRFPRRVGIPAKRPLF